MFTLARRLLIAGLAVIAGNAISTTVYAQEPPAGVDVLARGPVHEAFATTTEEPAPTAVLNRRPPEPVEELPPDQKPDGENVLWIPGYWHYDEERTDFIWISGFWRAAPPGRVWVPGSWREVPGGHQWVQGFWQDVAPATPSVSNATPAPAPEIEYLPAPPKPIEFAPSVPAPTSTSLYVSGSWVWRHHHFVWRPGFWISYRPGWVWTPAYYRWTPAGYVFVEGYWDYPLAARGTLFAPVYFQPGIIRPSYIYTPTIIVNEPCLTTSLFIRRGWGNYYFGDYFEPRYNQIGFTAWFGSPRGSGFAVGVTVGNRPHYDPLWDYYRIQHASNPQWAVHINDVYVGRYNGSIPRPPRTLVQQTTVINNITNVTNNNTTIVNNNKNVTNVANVTMLSSFKDVNKTNSNITLKPVTQQQRVAEQTTAKELQNVAKQRTRLETNLAQSGGIPKISTATAGSGNTAPPLKIQTIQLNTPKQALARAQISTNEKVAPPPNPVKINAAATTTTVNPTKTGTLPTTTTPTTGTNSNVKTNPNVNTPPNTTPNTTTGKPGTNINPMPNTTNGKPGTTTNPLPNTTTPNTTTGKPGTNMPNTGTTQNPTTPKTDLPPASKIEVKPIKTPPPTQTPMPNTNSGSTPNKSGTPSTTIPPTTNLPMTPASKIEVKPGTGGQPGAGAGTAGSGLPVTPGGKVGTPGPMPLPNGQINRNPMPNGSNGPVVIPPQKVIPKGGNNPENRGGNSDRRGNGEKPPSK